MLCIGIAANGEMVCEEWQLMSIRKLAGGNLLLNSQPLHFGK